MRKAEDWVDIYVNNYDLEALNREIAVLGPNLAGLLVEFMGELPESSRYKHDTLIWRIERMMQVSADFAQALRYLSLLTPCQAKACIEWSYFKDRIPDAETGRLRTKTDVAGYLGVCRTTWAERIQRGHDRINAELGILEA